MTRAGLALLLATTLWGIARIPLTSPTRRTRTRRRPAAPPVDVGSLALDFAERLRSGAPLATAWEASAASHGLATDWDPLRGPTGLADLGAAGMTLSAAIRLALRTGAPLADLLTACARAAAGTEDAAAARRIALAGPRSSTRILAALPLAGLAGAALLGLNVLGRILDGSVGTASALLGLAVWLVGHLWTRRLIARAAAAPLDTEHVTCDLAAAALQSGASIPGVLQVLAEVLDDERLATTARALLLGVDWHTAWGDRATGSLARSLDVAWTSGASPVALLQRRAERLRATAETDAKAAAGRLAARLVLPLGACFLPAFILLVLIPAIVSIVATFT
ncbi:type II secretion system F family protein [Bowdeniella nasicola]|uniref:type II secretion system F family protein n=1 Tax=Bowdeniella nasicola TaxID=208480 RepID=UPI0009FB143D|nr:type II secretion system F family protein [Bowdeniella nasicola]